MPLRSTLIEKNGGAEPGKDLVNDSFGASPAHAETAANIRTANVIDDLVEDGMSRQAKTYTMSRQAKTYAMSRQVKTYRWSRDRSPPPAHPRHLRNPPSLR